MANVVTGDPPTAPVCRFRDHPCASAWKWWDSRTDTSQPGGRRLLEHSEHPHLRIAEEFEVRLRPEVVREVHLFPPRADRDMQHGHTFVGRQLRDPDRVRNAFRIGARFHQTGKGGCATGPPLEKATGKGGEHREPKPSSWSLVVTRLALYRVPVAAGVAVPDQPGTGRAKLSAHQPRRRTLGQDSSGSSRRQPPSPSTNPGNLTRRVP